MQFSGILHLITFEDNVFKPLSNLSIKSEDIQITWMSSNENQFFVFGGDMIMNIVAIVESEEYE